MITKKKKISVMNGTPKDLPLPAYASAAAAGMDVAAALAAPLTLAPGAIALVPTGFTVAIPEGCELQVRPRSGLAVRHGVTVDRDRKSVV